MGLHEACGMGSAFIMLNLPLSIVYLYHPESRHWSLLAVLAVPALVLPAMCAITRLFRQQAGLTVMTASCIVGATIAATGHHAAMMALAHIGIFLGDRVGTTRLPVNLQTEIAFWKKHFAETSGYWQVSPKNVLDLILLFSLVAAITAAWLIGRQRVRALETAGPALEPAFARQHPSHSLKMPV